MTHIEKVKVVVIDDNPMTHEVIWTWFSFNAEASQYERISATSLTEGEHVLNSLPEGTKLFLMIDENLHRQKSTPLIEKARKMVGQTLADLLLISISALPSDLISMVHIISLADTHELLAEVATVFAEQGAQQAQATFNELSNLDEKSRRAIRQGTYKKSQE